jgi:isoquinoline 1-oxidoreductase subunit beta
MMTEISRRKLLQALGWSAGGIVVFAGAGSAVAFPTFPYRGAPEVKDAATWLSLRPDGTIEIISPRAEIGQGIAVALRQIVAEETGVGLDLVRCRLPDTRLINPARATVGSDSIKQFAPLLARAAAALSVTMRARAATILDEPADALEVSNGRYRAQSGTTATLSQLAKGETLIIGEQAVAAAKPLSLLPGRAHKWVGKAQATDRIEAIVTAAEPIYADDVRLPGMLFGAAIHPDTVDGTIGAVDDRACRKIPGYIGMRRDGGFIGMLAERRGALSKALSVLKVTMETGAGADDAGIARAMNINDALADGALEHVLKNDKMDPVADYDVDLILEVPMAAHVAMEPRTAVARFLGGKLEIWTGTQDVFFVRGVVADQLHLSESDVVVHGMRTGGAFGGRTICTVELEAARLARAAGRPVKVQWSRRDEFASGFQRPPSHHRIRARLGPDGEISDWWHAFRSGHVIFTSAAMGPFLQFATSFVADFGSQRGALPPYQAQRMRLEFEDVRLPVPTGPWRGLGAGPNNWAIETAIDALARKANRDPVDFRLGVTAKDQPRLAAVLKEVAARSGWPSGRAGHGFGVACGIYKDMSYAAVVAEVTISASGEPRVAHLWCAHDCGLVVNPDQVRAQIEGNLVWGIGMVLHEKLEVNDGRIMARSHADYALPRFSDVPEMDIALIGEENTPSGAGETAIVAAGAAITNAITSATGLTVTRLPYDRSAS